MSKWQFLLTDKNGNDIAELDDAHKREVYMPLNRVATGSFELPTDHRLVNVCRRLDQVLVKAYRDKELLVYGPMVPSYNKSVSATSKTVQFNFAGAGWRLSRRLIPATKSNTGHTYGTPGATVDIGAVGREILEDLNKEPVPAGVLVPSSDTGLRPGNIQKCISSYVGPWYYKNALQAISDLSAMQGGFEWEIKATEPSADALGIQIGLLNIVPALGSPQPNTWFEYGDGKHNVASWNELNDFTAVGNRFYSLPQSFPDSASTERVLMQQSIAAINERGTLYEDVVQADLVTEPMRQLLLEQNLAVRYFPRSVITFAPTVDRNVGVVPNFNLDYHLGDLVGFRAVEYGVETVNGQFRIYAVRFEINDNGDEQATPTLLSSEVTDTITTV